MAAAEQEVRDLRLLADHGSDVAVRLGAEGEVRYVSGSVARVLGLPPEVVLGVPLASLVDPDDAEVIAGAIRRSSRVGQAVAIVRARQSAPGDVWLEVAVRPLPDRGDGSEWVVLARDVTDRVHLHQEVGELALRDPLTGLANRRLVHEVLAQAIARLARRRAMVAVAFLDLDGFKAVNDRLGHGVGDRVLVTVASRLAAAVRPADTLGRLGGDEFCAVCSDLEHGFDVSELAGRLERACVVEVPAGVERLRLGASVGVAVTTTAEVSASLLLARADEAMYERKRARRSLRA